MTGEGYNHVILCLVDVVRLSSPQCVGSVHLYTPPFAAVVVTACGLESVVVRGWERERGRERCLHSKYLYDQAFHVINLVSFYEFVQAGETVLIRITII